MASSGNLGGVEIDSHGNLFVSDEENNRVAKWVPTITGSEGAHDAQTIYYSTAANSEYKGCGEHPEWANLVCETKPVAQPGAGGLPELPVMIMTYNVWDEVEKAEEKFGSVTRTKTETYDLAGRAMTSEETSTVDTTLPKVTNEYSTETGALVKQSTTTEGKTKAITSVFNKLGQLTSYTDADGNISKYVYDIDGRVEEINDGKGSQIYSYDATTGFLTKLLDSAAGTFTASYDVEGKLLTEGYPNGMTASYKFSPAGQATNLEYVKTTHCTEKCVWFSDAMTPSIHGEMLAQTSSLAKDSYVYDKAGRLTEAQETLAGKDCSTRLYAYDEESNRTTLTKRESSTETCATEGGSTEWHSYDTANRLTDAGVTYETFGDTTKLPVPDAGEHELTSSYYVDGQIASQTQNGETINYSYDPTGRPRERVSTGKTAATVISHYAAPGEALTWISEEEGKKWTRNIPGVDGALDAVQVNGEMPILQIHDLQGNIVGTASLSETETKLLFTYNSTEFGVPQPGTTPPKYAWLGASGLTTESGLASGVATTGGTSYVPQIAKNLQTVPVISPGAFPDGVAGTQYTATVSAASLASAQATATQIFEQAEAARQKAAAEAAVKAQEEACEQDPESCSEPPTGGVDPSIGHQFSPNSTKLLVHALTVGGSLLGAVIGKFIPGPEGSLFAEALKLVAGNVVDGLNLCLEGNSDAGGPAGYKCGVIFNYIAFPVPPYVIPENIEIQDCYQVGKGHDCTTVYTVGVQLGLS